MRIKSLLRKAEQQGDMPGKILATAETERDLALMLGALPDAVRGAYDELAPNRIADFAFTLGQTFSSFYAACHILSEADVALRRSRLALCLLTLRQLELCLSLLGIETPDRM